MATLSLTNRKLVKPLLDSVVSPMTTGEATKIGKLVYVAGDGLVYETDAADASKTTPRVGLVVSGGAEDKEGDVASGERVAVLWFGRCTLGITLDETKTYYVANVTSTVNGLIGDAAGTVTRRVGQSIGPDVLFFNPDMAAATS